MNDLHFGKCTFFGKFSQIALPKFHIHDLVPAPAVGKNSGTVQDVECSWGHWTPEVFQKLIKWVDLI